MDSISFWNRIAESSPLIVLILLAGYAVVGHFVMKLLARLDKKDDIILSMSREMVEAMTSVREAVDKLTEALRNAR
jgi:HEPN domain-containing protein